MSRFAAVPTLVTRRFHDRVGIAYLAVLAAAVCCYAALGMVLAILPRYVPEHLGGGSTAIGLAVGAPALTGLLARPLGGRLADRLGPLRPLRPRVPPRRSRDAAAPTRAQDRNEAVAR